MTYDDWQSFLVSDIGKNLIQEFQYRVSEAKMSTDALLQYHINEDRLAHINNLITVRSVNENWIIDFQRGLLSFVDDPGTDNV